MIRINLLGQTRPKASRRPTMAVDTGGAMPVAFIGAGVLVGVLVLGFFYYTWEKQLTEENNKIKALQIQKTELEQTKQQVEAFEKQKAVLQLRVNTIEQLQRDRTGGQELLDMVADRKSTRLNSSHGYISYAVFCLKKKKIMSIGHSSMTLHVI